MMTVCLWAVLQHGDADAILKKVEAARPTKKELALYALDWVDSFEAAKKKAARDRRPILLLYVQNEHGGLFTGHC